MVSVLSRLKTSLLSVPTLVLAAVLVVACGTAPPAGGDPAAPSAVPSVAAPPTSPAATSPTASTATSPTPTSPPASPGPARSSAGQAPVELPRGGTSVFPRYRLVGYAGLTGAKTLGRLGTGPLDQRVAEIEHRARPYAAGRQILPVVEVIATIVSSSPGRDGKYRTRLSDDKIATYLAVARKHRAVLLLDIQPGRADFLDEVKAYEKWLRQPDVGVALDPEWAMDSGQVPGRVFGHTTGKELDSVAAYLAGLVGRFRLPEKIMVYHQLAPRIVHQESGLKAHRGVAIVKSVDGIGSRAAKTHTYRLVNKTTPPFVRPGFKLFFDEDRRHGKLMTPAQVLALKPRPDYVLYE